MIYAKNRPCPSFSPTENQRNYDVSHNEIIYYTIQEQMIHINIQNLLQSFNYKHHTNKKHLKCFIWNYSNSSMDSDTPWESTFSIDEGLDEDVDDPYSSLLSMGASSESTYMPIIPAAIFLLDLRLGLANSHLATSSFGSNFLIIFIVLERRVSFFVNLKS